MLTELVSEVLDEFDAEHIFLIDGFDNHFEGYVAIFLDGFGENRLFTVAHTLYQFAIDCVARSLGLETSFFAAMANHLVVVRRSVPEFTCKTRFSRIHLAVDDDSESETPTYIHKQHILFLADSAAKVFAVGHCASVVVDAHIQADFLGHHLSERHFTEIEPAVTITRLGIYTSREVDVDVDDFFAVVRR